MIRIGTFVKIRLQFLRCERRPPRCLVTSLDWITGIKHRTEQRNGRKAKSNRLIKGETEKVSNDPHWLSC